MWQTVQANALKYLNSRGTVKAKIVMRNNEKVGDATTIQTLYDGEITGIITKMDIYSGYNNIADIEVLEWEIG